MSHLSNPQAQRTLKFLTGVLCTGAGVHSVFFSSYDHVEGFEGKEHIFTNVQRDAREFVDRTLYGIDTEAIAMTLRRQQEQEQRQRQQEQHKRKAAAAAAASTQLKLKGDDDDDAK